MTETVQEDTLFGEIITLEARRDSILTGFGEAPQTDELVQELADIESALQSHYVFMDGVELFKTSARFGVPL